MKVPFSAKTLGADFITISAHKIGGPKGIGALYIGPRVRNPRPLLPGGGQEGGLRSGTEATAQIAGFAKAVELRTEGLEDKLRHMAEIRAYAKEQLSAIPDLSILGRSDAPHILSVSLVGWPSQNIVNDLGSQGICISAGSACHQGKPSQVVAALKPAQEGLRRCRPPELRPGDHPGGHRCLCPRPSGAITTPGCPCCNAFPTDSLLRPGSYFITKDVPHVSLSPPGARLLQDGCSVWRCR